MTTNGQQTVLFSTVADKGVSWFADPTLNDLMQRFPFSIALMDDAGGPAVVNRHFEQNYRRDVLACAPVRALLREAGPGWHTIQLPGSDRGQVDIKAQVLRFEGRPLLILNDADPHAGQKLDQLQARITDLEKRSSLDPMTGTWNRAHFDRVVATELNRSIRNGQPVSLILLDVDHLNGVNAKQGRVAGDSALCGLARVIASSLRSLDTLFRWGGGQFAILSPSAGYRTAAELAESLRGEVERHHFGDVGALTISLGVAEYIAPELADTWFERADRALRRAKQGGRNRVSVDPRGSSDRWEAESGPSVVRLVWQEGFQCGEPTIDREHRELFDLANATLDASFHSFPGVFGSALEKLLAHIAQHFADEEALLAKHDYQELEEHKQAHARLLERAEELKFSAVAGKTTLGDLVEFLAKTVVAQHLLRMDRRFYPLFRKEFE